jgi:hypothetical protein
MSSERLLTFLNEVLHREKRPENCAEGIAIPIFKR